MNTGRFVFAIAVAWVAVASCSPRNPDERGARAADSTGVSGAAAPASQPGAPADGASGTAEPGIVPPFLAPSELAKIPEAKLSEQEMVALAPPVLLLRDLGFTTPPTMPDTTGLKNRAKIQREWVEALVAYGKPDFAGVRTHLDRAREFHAASKGADIHWPNRIRNLEAALVYATEPAGEAKKRFGEIAEPNPLDPLDTGLEWVLLHEDLRRGREKEAVARLQIVQRSPLSAGLEARRLLSRIYPETPSGAPGTP